MKRASLLVYLGILLASLALAYLTWVQGPKKPGDKVTMSSCGKGGVLGLTYETKDQTVIFSRKKSLDSGEPSWWVKVVRRSSVPTVQEAPAEEGAERKESAPDETHLQKDALPAAPPVTEVFKANDRLEAEIDKFCPWTALRSLGKPEKAKLAEFGLTEPVESVTVEQASGPHRFRLGETTFGPQDRYVADAETGEVFLVAGQDLRDLLHPKSRFMDRSLYGFETKEVSRIRLRAGQKEKELVQSASEEGKEQGWVDSRSPKEAKVLYRNWVRRLLALRPIDYVGATVGEEDGACAAPAGATEELHVTFMSTVKEIGSLTVYKGEKTDPKGDAPYYACSEHTELVVTVPKTQAETLLKDLEDVLSD